MKKVLNQVVTRIVGLGLVVTGVYIKTKYSPDVFSGADMLLIVFGSIGMTLLFCSCKDVKEYVLQKINKVKQDLFYDIDDEEEWEDEPDYDESEYY